MKTKKFLFTAAIGFTIALAVISGCKKKDSTAADTDTGAAQDDASATYAVNDSKNISDAAVQGNASNYSPQKPGEGRSLTSISGCATVWSRGDTTINSTSDTVIYINFGPNDCLCKDGIYRRGEIIIYWNKLSGNFLHAYFDSGTAITMTFNNYYVEDINIAGTRTLTNMGLNTAGAQNWSFSANLSLTFSSGQKASWISNRTNTLTTVGGNMYYMITGSASGISRTGVSYTLTITQALYHTFFPWWLGGCPFIEQGKLTIAKNNGNDIYVNFGTGVGTCSDAATATINNTNYNISQKWW